jgi:hypothetical protein
MNCNTANIIIPATINQRIMFADFNVSALDSCIALITSSLAVLIVVVMLFVDD